MLCPTTWILIREVEWISVFDIDATVAKIGKHSWDYWECIHFYVKYYGNNDVSDD